MTSHARRLILGPDTHRHENIKSHNIVGLVYEYIVACLLGNATRILWVLDLTLDLLGIH
jgi:hypothetical protein